MDKEEIKDSLSEFELSQPFTIEHLVRKMGEKRGEKWAGAFEVNAQVEIEKILLDDGLIKEYGETKLYTKQAK